jgi:hypothetical protein
MIKLNLPEADIKLKRADGKVWIWDYVRKKYLVLTPEEWVRQHFVHYLIHTLKYPKSLIRIEGGLSYNQLQKRSDIVVFDRTGNPWMVIECKSPDLVLSQNTLHQASVYNYTLKANFLAVTNGLSHYYCEIDWAAQTSRVIPSAPSYPAE